MKKYYINGQTNESEALSLEDIQAKGLKTSDYVWFAGLPEWKPVEEVEELKPFIKKVVVPPPFQPKPVTPPPFEPKAVIPPLFEPKVSTPPTQQTTTTQPLENKHFGYQLAKKRSRFWAELLSIILFSIVWVCYKMITGGSLNPEQVDENSLFDDIVSAILIPAIFGIVFYPLWSGGLGHKIMGLKVISAKDGSDYNTAQKGALRESLKSLFGAFIIPIIWFLWDDDRQNLYDKVTETYVVKNKK